MPETIRFLRSEEGLDLMRSESDIITLRLLIAAKFYQGMTLHKENKWPIEDYDVLFSKQVLQLYFQDQENLVEIVAGAEQDLVDGPFSTHLLRTQEAIALIHSHPATITKRLLIGGHNAMCKAVQELKLEPMSAFDYLFFIQTLQSFFWDYEVVEQILSGEEASPFVF